MKAPFLLALCIIFLSACSYQLQGRNNPLRELGIEKIYVTQFHNRTFTPGIEQLFSTAMVREIQKSGTFRLVSSEKEADAILSGEVTGSDTNTSSSKSLLISTNKTVDVASEYTADVQCAISLVDKNGRTIFSQSASGSKIYPGAARLGDAGATNSLVNDSEQRLAVQFLASQMMAGVYQRMIDIF
jgi:outer membrane lipopolysaccharide assembly protein LptE/RlpB